MASAYPRTTRTVGFLSQFDTHELAVASATESAMLQFPRSSLLGVHYKDEHLRARGLARFREFPNSRERCLSGASAISEEMIRVEAQSNISGALAITVHVPVASNLLAKELRR